MKQEAKSVAKNRFGAGGPLLDAAFYSCVSWAIGDPGIREQFKKDTGNDLALLIPKTPIDKMINDATGITSGMLAVFCEWVTVNIWGEEA